LRTIIDYIVGAASSTLPTALLLPDNAVQTTPSPVADWLLINICQTFLIHILGNDSGFSRGQYSVCLKL